MGKAATRPRSSVLSQFQSVRYLQTKSSIAWGKAELLPYVNCFALPSASGRMAGPTGLRLPGKACRLYRWQGATLCGLPTLPYVAKLQLLRSSPGSLKTDSICPNIWLQSMLRR